MDLHVHTPGSRDFDDKTVEATKIVEFALERGLEAIAITDHNTGSFVDAIKSAAKGKSLAVFPGVEITCRGGASGIHIIALLDVQSETKHIESLLSELGLGPDSYGKEDAIVPKEVLEVARIIERRGGLAILAHANSTHGALCDMRGQQRIDLIKDPSVQAVEATDFQDEGKKKDKKRTCDFLDGSDPEYKRKLAVYQASDNPGASGLHSVAGIGSRCSLFKVDRISLEGLRQCFTDPDVRIRQDYEYSTSHYPRIKSVQVTGGFLDGAELIFHEGLNSILGAKGAGKSLLVEAMRFALDQPPRNPEILADHEAKLAGRLEHYGTVEVIFTDETGKDVAVKRTYNPADDNPYEGGEHRDLVRAFPVFFLSQNEILRIAETPEEQLAFIDRFFDFRAYQVSIRELERDLQKLDAELAECMRASMEALSIQKQVDTIKGELLKIDAALKDPAFEKYTTAETKDRTLREQIHETKTIAERLAEAIRLVGGVPVAPVPEGLGDDPAVRRALDRSKQSREIARNHIEAATQEIKIVQDKAAEDYQNWRPELEIAKKEYDSAIRTRGGDARGLAQKRVKLVKEYEDLTRRLTTAKERADALPQAGQTRKSVVQQHRQAHEAYAAERKDRCQRIQSESEDRLKVQLHEASNSEEFRKRLSALKRGSYLKDVEIEQICRSVDSGAFMRAVLSYSLGTNRTLLDDLAKKVDLDPERMRSLATFLVSEYTFEQLLALEYTGIPQDKPEISYNVGGRFEPLARLSIGQKCTAMLLIALTSGTAPIVIDQPEDSLDLRSIWQDVCSRVRKGKHIRQFIFTTHSSSIAVATDSDKFIIMEADATRGRVVFSGSMDHSPVSEEALRYLEGGPPTYKLKFRKFRGGDILAGVDDPEN